jgi:DNA processing protein
MMNDEERAAYLALALVPGIGVVRLRTLLDACETASGALAAPFAFLCSLPLVSRAAATAIKAARPEAGRDVMAAARELGAAVLLPGDDDYPPALSLIPDPPAALFALGRLALLGVPAVAIVGSRNHSSYGGTVCREMATAAATAGVAVVSGMARGLDAVAHQAALDAGGDTIGVLGNGLGIVYPAANRALYERVAHDGLLLTEHPPGERPHAGSFPRRNRLISGLARVTVVVEAAVGSGALITADAALEQGREAMAVPGPITSALSAGTNRLVRDGAAPYLEPDDLLRHYPSAVRPATGTATATPSTPVPVPPPAVPKAPVAPPEPAPLPEDLDDEERALVVLVGAEPVALEALATCAARPVSDVLATLATLEIAGVVEQLAGRMFRRC